jgi:NAD(P)H dehydrogenase (quinone)
MTILLTGGTGHFGTLAAQHLSDRAADFKVSVRDPAKATALTGQGIEVRHGDFDAPDDLVQTFAGIDTLVFVSANGSNEVRIAQHRGVVSAAQRAGVNHIIYTSAPHADTSPLSLAEVHKATEEAIAQSGIPYTFLRNGMYHENYTVSLPSALDQGVLVTSAGSGRVASVARDDLALAAAVVATTPGHENTIYELTGPSAWTFDELAALAASVSGRPLAHKSIPGAELVEILAGPVGFPRELADLFVDIYEHIGQGVLAEVTTDLEKLIGRPPAPILDAVRATLS